MKTCLGRRLLIATAMMTLSAAPLSAAEHSPPAAVQDQERPYISPSGKHRTYDEWFVQRKDVFTKDPYLWVYNASFAKDFHMPNRWIDAELRGADALAFRTGSAFPLCGWGGDPDACKPVTMCLIEMYFHEGRNPLPWNDSLRWTDLQVNLTSLWTLTSLRRLLRHPSREGMRKSPFTDPQSGRELSWWFVLAASSAPYGGPTWIAYDRSAFEHYSLVVLDSRCPSEDIAKLELRPFPSEEPEGRVRHTVVLPKSWRDRISRVMKRIEEQDRAFFQERLDELKKERSKSPSR